MKKTILVAAISVLAASCAKDEGKVTITLPQDFTENTLVVSHVTVENMFNATSQEELNQMFDTLEVNNGVAELTLDPAGASRYNINLPFATRMEPEFYAAPGENLEVVIAEFSPLHYAVKGSELMEDLTAFYAATNPIQLEYAELIAGDEEILPDTLRNIVNRYDAAVKKFVDENPDSPAIPFAITELSGDDFKIYYDNMSPVAKKSILMPFAETFNREVEEMLKERAAEESRKAEVASGKITAPDFTLPDLAGKMVSLSDFKGKWVVLDFWGSWCGWCIKGFPALKEAYEKYGDKIVVIGIDCNESEEEWREGLKKHQLPWLNLYNGNDKDLYVAYKIEGFPTKAIINPEGKLVDLTTGEDPSFFNRLAAFVE